MWIILKNMDNLDYSFKTLLLKFSLTLNIVYTFLTIVLLLLLFYSNIDVAINDNLVNRHIHICIIDRCFKGNPLKTVFSII